MIACLGQMAADVVVKPVDGFPQLGMADRVDLIDLRAGGCSLNTASVLNKLGVETAIIGKVGRDIFGDFLHGIIRERGIDVGPVVRDPGVKTSSVIVMISTNGERSFLYCPGSAEAMTIDDIDFGVIKRSRIVHVAGVMKLESLDVVETLRRIKEAGALVSLETDWDVRGRWLEWIGPCLPYVDIFLPSLEEAKMICGKQQPEDVIKFFMDGYGIETIALKMGIDGCWIQAGRDRIRIPSYDVKTVDASGAGDAFAGGFLAGYSKGWDMETVGRFASACGAMCVTEIGTTEGIRSMDETLAFMKKTATRKISKGDKPAKEKK